MWDEPKRLANLSKHGLDFRHLDATFFDDALVRATHSQRWRAIGMNVHGVVAVIFVALGLEHDPEKWIPVFRKDHAQTKIMLKQKDRAG